MTMLSTLPHHLYFGIDLNKAMQRKGKMSMKNHIHMFHATRAKARDYYWSTQVASKWSTKRMTLCIMFKYC